jgi:hypothetical protein
MKTSWFLSEVSGPRSVGGSLNKHYGAASRHFRMYKWSLGRIVTIPNYDSARPTSLFGMREESDIVAADCAVDRPRVRCAQICPIDRAIRSTRAPACMTPSLTRVQRAAAAPLC